VPAGFGDGGANFLKADPVVVVSGDGAEWCDAGEFLDE
jgi:hypothetical protein